MPYLIQSDEELRLYLPNALRTVTGEMSFFDKLTPDLDAAEAWLTLHVIAPQSLNSLPDEAAQELAFTLARRIVVSDALLRAVPQLDLVLTPNGFGIVSNQNIVPASKDRVDRLLASLELVRDRSLQQLLTMLYAANGGDWYKSDQGRYFSSTLFPFLDVATLLGHREHIWSLYQDYQPRIILMEQELADKFISLPLYDRLRFAQLHNCFSLLEADLINRLRAIELSLLRGEPLNIPVLHSLVTFIRQNPEEFPEWHSSPVAALYTNQSFTNQKQSGGYWF